VVAERLQGNEARYDLLETIRQYAREKLSESGEEEQIRQRHVDYFLKLTLEADQNLKGTKSMEAISCLEEEHANLLAALEWSFENSVEQGQQIVGALWWSWSSRGYISLGNQWIQKALAVRTDTPDPIQAKLLNATAWWASIWLNDRESARTSAEQSIAIYRRLEDREGIAFPLIVLAEEQVYFRAEYEQAITLYQESLKYYKEAGNKWGMRQITTRLGIVAQLQGNYEQAEALFQESLAVCRESNDLDGISWALKWLGNLAAFQGNYRRARVFYEEGLSIVRVAKLHFSEWRFLLLLGRLSMYVGDLEQARNLTEEALKIDREINDKPATTPSLRRLGKLAALKGDHPGARSLYAECLLLAHQMASTDEIAITIISIGHYKLSRGFPKEFARLFGMSEGIAPEALQGEGHLFIVETERAVESARTALGEETYTAAYDAGRQMSLDKAVVYAIKELQEPWSGRSVVSE